MLAQDLVRHREPKPCAGVLRREERVENLVEVFGTDARPLVLHFYDNPGLDRYAFQAVPPIHIVVDSGKVSLEGVVSTQADKDMANIRANGVSGIFSVVNNLRVEK